MLEQLGKITTVVCKVRFLKQPRLPCPQLMTLCTPASQRPYAHTPIRFNTCLHLVARHSSFSRRPFLPNEWEPQYLFKTIIGFLCSEYSDGVLGFHSHFLKSENSLSDFDHWDRHMNFSSHQRKCSVFTQIPLMKIHNLNVFWVGYSGSLLIFM
jgi:hypothetical protein